MELKTIHYPRTVLDGQQDLNGLVEGDCIKVETNLAEGGGEEILSYTVPTGKKVKIWCRFTIEEVD